MIDTIEKLNDKFNNKYNYLKLLNVTYDEETCQCVITILYPYQVDEISAEDKEEITKFYQEFLSLQGQVKVKFKKSFLDDKLIINEVVEFFKVNKKGIYPYISMDNIKSSYKGQDVFISLSLNQDVLTLIDELELTYELKKHIEKLFIANVFVDIQENEEMISEDIVFEDFPQATSKVRRYEVKLEKTLIGGEFSCKPEYIGDIKEPGSSIILAGFILNFTRKSFIAKKGKRAGQERLFWTFNLKDAEGGTIECVYFCPKAHEKILESLEQLMMISCLGDVKVGLSGKLTYYIKKMAFVSPIEKVIESVEEETFVHKKTVFPEIIPRETQTNLFEEKAKYNDFIMKNNIVVFDLETTGTDTNVCEITEIGAVKIVNGEITERFVSFTKTKEPIPELIQGLTGITDEMIKDAPRPEDVIYDFYEWSKGCILSGYNLIAFDLKILKRYADKINVKFTNDVIDTFIVARQAPIKPSKYKLEVVVKYLGLTLVNAHRAYADAYATAQVLMELNKLK